jgi:Mycothiol maleylpyruvate isomerase N-terminal domain
MSSDSERTKQSRYFEAYREVLERIGEIVDADGCEQEVPACPGWRVREVLAHLAGLCEDWVDQRLDGYGSDSWTAEQISRHAGRPCLDLQQSWSDAMTSFGRLDD